MILDQKKTTIAYRCPHCTESVFSIVGVFTLSGDLIRLKCACEESDLLIERTSEGKLRLTVPCLVCPKPQTFTVSPGAFFDREMLTLPCPYTGLDIAFIGTTENVKNAIEETGKQVLQILRELCLEGTTVLLITHDETIASSARRIVRLSDGKIIADHRQEVDWA